MREHINTLSTAQAQDFCVRLWLELTIVGRIIWTDERLDTVAQHSALKWLNEIQHRLWSAHARSARGEPDALIWLLDRIDAHCEEAQALKAPVRWALEKSIEAVTAAQAR